MGYGAYLSIRNDSSETVQCRILSQQCMYDHGVEGSNLSLFDGAFIAANTALPITGGHYIESKSSGDCVLSSSSFQLYITGLDQDNPINITFKEEAYTYYIEPQTHTKVTIDNDIKYATIVVTLD